MKIADTKKQNRKTEEKPTAPTERRPVNWKLAAEILRGFRHNIVLATLSVLLSTAFSYAVPYVTSFTLDYVIQGTDRSTPSFLLPLISYWL